MANAKLPYEIKELRGTLNVTREKDRAHIGTEILTMEPPGDLNEWGAAYWTQIMEGYGNIGLIKKEDLGAFQMCCKWFGIACACLDIVDAKGYEIEKFFYGKHGEVCGSEFIENPMMKAAERATKLYVSICGKFGLTPVDRSRVILGPQKKEDKFTVFDD